MVINVVPNTNPEQMLNAVGRLTDFFVRASPTRQISRQGLGVSPDMA